MLCVLLTAAVLLAPPPVVEKHGLLVYKDGFVEPVELPPTVDREDVGHVWTWSQETPPRRFTLSELKEPETSKAAETNSHSLAVDVIWGAGDPDASAELVAAPVQMWLEVPEHLLPAWRLPAAVDGVSKLEVPSDGRSRWRMRVRGRTHGSWWMDIAPETPSVVITPIPSPSVTIEALDREGGPLDSFGLSLLNRDRAKSEELTAQFWSSEAGVVTLSSLPDQRDLTVVLTAPSYLSRVLQGRSGSLPERIYLEKGSSIFGLVVDEEDRPLEGVEMTLESFLSSHSTTTFRETEWTDGKGGWHFANVPRGAAVLRARMAGHAPHLETIELQDPEVDWGGLVLRRGGSLQLTVIDDVGKPVANARVEGPGGVEAFTDRQGNSEIFPLDTAKTSALEVSAEAHLGTVISVLPSPAPMEVELVRAYQVRGRLVEAEGVPVEQGNIRIEAGRSFRVETLQPGGEFLIDLAPGKAAHLTLGSSATREVKVSVAEGAPGQVRDLGDIVAQAGLSVVGRIVDDATGEPIEGVRLWTPRPSFKGPLVAWAQSDLLEASTDSLGMFEIRGLSPGRTTLRSEKAGFARMSKELELESSSPVLDLGDLRLATGGVVLVHGSGNASLAKLDVTGRWLEIDMIEASVSDGRARFTHVPPGDATVTLWEGLDLLCEKPVRVRDGEGAEVECDESRLRVTGTVSVGGQVDGPGQLVWTPELLVDVPAMIINTTTPGGLKQQKVLGAGRPTIQVDVDASGFFSSDRLRSGAWDVTWSPAAGSAGTVPVGIEIPETSEPQLNLDFPVSRVSGWVTDEAGKPVVGARVTDLGTQAVAFSTDEGRFELRGLESGPRRLQAREAERISDIVEVALHPGELPDEEIHLILREWDSQSLSLVVLDGDSQPVPSAVVFFAADQQTQVFTTDLEGQVTVPFDTSIPARVRSAAWSERGWILGKWLTFEDALENGITLAQGSTGSLELATNQVRGPVRILSRHGWDLTFMLTMIGQHPMVRPEKSLVIRGLPASELLTISLGEKTQTTTIEDSGITALKLD